MTARFPITPEMEQAARTAAEKAGRRDWKRLLEEKAARATLGVFGLDADCTTDEAAELLGVHRMTILNYIRRGLFPGTYRLSYRNIRIPMREVLAMKERTERVA